MSAFPETLVHRHVSQTVTLTSLRRHSLNGGEDNNISRPSSRHSPVFLVSIGKSPPRGVRPAVIIMGYSALSASCFLQLK